MKKAGITYNPNWKDISVCRLQDPLHRYVSDQMHATHSPSIHSAVPSTHSSRYRGTRQHISCSLSANNDIVVTPTCSCNNYDLHSYQTLEIHNNNYLPTNNANRILPVYYNVKMRQKYDLHVKGTKHECQ